MLCRPSVGDPLALRLRSVSASLATAASFPLLSGSAPSTTVPALFRSMASLTQKAFALEVLL